MQLPFYHYAPTKPQLPSLDISLRGHLYLLTLTLLPGTFLFATFTLYEFYDQTQLFHEYFLIITAKIIFLHQLQLYIIIIANAIIIFTSTVIIF